MGRRAADLTAPVPVLGVPALVGVRGWRTIAGDRAGGALLHSWGPHCNIGVQTSPGVGRNFSMQLTGALSPLPDGVQMSSSFISGDSEYKEMQKSDKEKGAILKLRTRSSKTKKEVTFKTVACEASKDVTCSLEIRQTHCHAREIEGGSHLSDGAAPKSKLRPSRYSNGSVVDSEAIGGISVDGVEAEPAGKKQSKPPSHRAEQPGRPSQDASKKICVQCGGRQRDAPGGMAPDQKSSRLGEKGVKPTPGCFPTAELEHKPEQRRYKISEEGIPVSPRPLPCPLHSRSFSSGAGQPPPTRPSGQTVKAAIEPAPGPPLTPQMATAAKSNVLDRRSAPLSVYVSVHAAPDCPTPPLYTTATGAGAVSMSDAHKRGGPSATLASAGSIAVANAKCRSQSWAFAAKLNADGRESKRRQMAIKRQTVSSAPGDTSAAHTLDTSTQTAPVDRCSVPPLSGPKAQQRYLLSSVTDSSLKLGVYSARPNSSNRQISRCPLSVVAPHPISVCANAKAIALRDSPTGPKPPPPAAAVSSPMLTGNASGTVPLRSADGTQHNGALGGNNANQPGKGGKAQTRDEPGSGCVASAEGNSSAAKYHRRDADASHNKSEVTLRYDLQGGSEVNGNPIKKLVSYESRNLENPSVSQVTSLRNYASLIKPGGSWLHARVSTERLGEGYAERWCPPVNSEQRAKKVEKEKHAQNPTPSSPSPVNPHGPVVRLASSTDPPSLPPAPKGPELSPEPTPPFNNPPGLRSCPPPPTPPRRDPELGTCPGDAGGAHSHPAEVSRLLPPSPQCCGSASLRQKLESVEASLAANKDRIATLLNIIHDLETSHTPGSRWRCDAAGQELRNCATCQKTACVVYSVEYDFRQQERHLMEVLNHSTGGKGALSTRLARSLNIGALRNTVKNLNKSKVKSKKLCKTLFKWLPGKIQQR